MSTGDLLNNLRCLQSCLRAVNIIVPDNRQNDLKTGVPDVYFHILRSILLDYSHHVVELIATHQIQLSVMNNDRFIDGVYKVLRDVFNYKPSITKDMFLRTGCAERKLIMMQDVIRMVQRKNQELKRKIKVKGRKANGASKSVANSHTAPLALSSSQDSESSNTGPPQINSVTAAPMTKPSQPQVSSSDLFLQPPPPNGGDGLNAVASATRPNIDGLCFIRPQAFNDDDEPRSHAALVTCHLPCSTNQSTPYMSHDQGYRSLPESSSASESIEISMQLTNKMSACMQAADVLYSRLNNILSRVDILEEKLACVDIHKDAIIEQEKNKAKSPEKLASMDKQLKIVMDRLVLMENQIVILNTLGIYSGKPSPSTNTVQEPKVSGTPGVILNNNNCKTTEVNLSALIPSPPLSASPLTSEHYPTPINKRLFHNQSHLDQQQTQIDRVNKLMKQTEYLLKPIDILEVDCNGINDHT